MVGQMILFCVIWHHNQKKWYHLVEQAQGYLINENLFRPGLTEWNPRMGGGGDPSTQILCTTVGVWVRFLQFYFFISLLVLVLIEKIHLALNTTFDHISKHLKNPQNNTLEHIACIFTSVLGVW